MSWRASFVVLVLLVGCDTVEMQSSLDAALPDANTNEDPIVNDPDLGIIPHDLRKPKPDLFTPDLTPAGDPLQPATHYDDAQLLDPTRVPLTTCWQSPIPPSQIVDYFPDGMGVWAPNALPRSNDQHTGRILTPYRHCHSVTGCSDWIVGPTFTVKYLFLFVLDAQSVLWLHQYNESGTFITKLRVESSHFVASFAVDHDASGFIMRRFVVDLGQKGVCIESLVTSAWTGDNTRQEYYFTELGYSSYSGAALPARPAPQALPTLTMTCTGAPATSTELYGWFPPGMSTRALHSDASASVWRECHPATGCSEWSDLPLFPDFFDHLFLQGSTVVLSAVDLTMIDPTIGIQPLRDYVLTDSAFHSGGLDIVFTPTCVRATGHVFAPRADHSNQIEQVIERHIGF